MLKIKCYENCPPATSVADSVTSVADLVTEQGHLNAQPRKLIAQITFRREDWGYLLSSFFFFFCTSNLSI